MISTYYSNWRHVPAATWRWPNFSPQKLACRGTGSLRVDAEALDKLQALCNTIGKPMVINSAYRSAQHNRAVGGAPRSKHLEGRAFDVSMHNHDRVEFEAAARAAGFTGFGFYPNFMHIDIGHPRSWGNYIQADYGGERPQLQMENHT